MDDEIALVEMAPGRDAEFAELLAEYRAEGDDPCGSLSSVAWQGYGPFYALISRMKQGGYPTPDIVATDAYFIEQNAHILGRLFLRHHLTPALERRGGHVGYAVRPSQRNRGVATAALRLALLKLHDLGVSRALITCDLDNERSARVVEKCGGERTTDSRFEDGRTQRRYWIQTLRA